MKKQNSLRGIMLLLILLAFALRLYRLNYQPLRGDESFTIQFSAHPLSWLLPSVANVEPNPPLYYFLLHYWMQALGQSEFSTRFLSLLFGVLCVPLVYLLGKSLSQPRVGVLSAFLVAINPFQVWHSQDVRNYTIWPALSMTGLIFLLQALREGKIRYWAGYAVMTLLSLYTHYYDLFMLLFQNALFLAVFFIANRKDQGLKTSRGRLLLTWLVIQVSLVLTYGPWLVYGSSVRHYQGSGYSPTLWVLLYRCLSTFSLGETVPTELAAVSTPFLLLILLIGFLYAFKKNRSLALLLILYIAVPSFSVFIVAQARPIFRERYLNAIAPAYCLTFAYALIALRDELSRWKVVPLAIGVAFFALTGTYSLYNHYDNPLYHKSPDWRALTDYLATETEQGDVLILNYPDPTFSYYYDGIAPSFILPRGLLTEEVKIETAETLKLVSETYERIWFYPLKDPGWDKEGFVETWLVRHSKLIEERDIFNFRWLIYQPVLVSLDDVQHPLALRLGESIWLRGYDSAPEVGEELQTILVQPGSALRLSLYWEATGTIETSYTVFIHLLDAQDHIWAQQDSLPQGGDFPTDEWMTGDIIIDHCSILMPPNTPAGDYTLALGLYDPSNYQRLPVFDERRVSQGDRAIIAQVRIE